MEEDDMAKSMAIASYGDAPMRRERAASPSKGQNNPYTEILAS